MTHCNFISLTYGKNKKRANPYKFGLPFLMSLRSPNKATTIIVKITVFIIYYFNYGTMI